MVDVIADGTRERSEPLGGQTPRPETVRSSSMNVRLASLDAYRGLIMVSLAFGGFGLAGTAANQLKSNPGSGVWEAVRYQFSHAQWVGCSYWDLIQPSFMFMVGVSMAYSYVKRKRLGQPYGQMLRHAGVRSLVLVLLGVLLSSNWSNQTNWAFMNVLSQIGLGYTFLFLLWGRSTLMQAITAALLLFCTWLAYTLYGVLAVGNGIDLAQGAEQLGVTAEWAQQHLDGVGSAWHKNANFGQWIDQGFLNLWPRQTQFDFNRGGYQSINFVPSLATMVFGLMCGELLRSERGPNRKLLTLVVAGACGLIIGILLDRTGVCPLVKRIWTPSWAIYSTGCCCLILAGLYWIIDIRKHQWWSFPLVVVGMNSIAVYMMIQLIRVWLSETLQRHFGQGVFELLGQTWAPTVQSTLVGLSVWLICYYLYRQKIFIRI